MKLTAKEEARIRHSLFFIKEEFRRKVFSECDRDLVLFERRCAELVDCQSAHQFHDLTRAWSLAAMLESKLDAMAKNELRPISLDDVWQIFKTEFFGHGSWTAAEVLARRLLWKLALSLSNSLFSTDEERDIISYFANKFRPENLRASDNYQAIALSLRDCLKHHAGFKSGKTDEPNTLALEAWSIFRRLLKKHRTTLYSTS